MIVNLIKKDLLIGKKYIPFSLILVLAIPLFISWQASLLMGTGAFVLTTVYAGVLLEQQISLIELRYQKAESLLCAMTYTRKNIVKSKYFFFLFIFACITVVYGMLALIFPQVVILTADGFSTAFLINTIIFSVYIPIQYKIGAEKMKYFFAIVLFGASFGMVYIYKWMAGLDLSFFEGIPNYIYWILSFAVSIIILIVSICISVRLYLKKEL